MKLILVLSPLFITRASSSHVKPTTLSESIIKLSTHLPLLLRFGKYFKFKFVPVQSQIFFFPDVDFAE